MKLNSVVLSFFLCWAFVAPRHTDTSDSEVQMKREYEHKGTLNENMKNEERKEPEDKHKKPSNENTKIEVVMKPDLNHNKPTTGDVEYEVIKNPESNQNENTENEVVKQPQSQKPTPKPGQNPTQPWGCSGKGKEKKPEGGAMGGVGAGKGAIKGTGILNAKPAGHPLHFAHQRHKRLAKSSDKQKHENVKKLFLTKRESDPNPETKQNEDTENEVEKQPQSQKPTPKPGQKPTQPWGCSGKGKEKKPEGAATSGGGAGGGEMKGTGVPNAKPAGHPFHFAYRQRHKRYAKSSENKKLENVKNILLKKRESDHEKPSDENKENELENVPESTETTPEPSQNPTRPGGCNGGGGTEGNGEAQTSS